MLRIAFYPKAGDARQNITFAPSDLPIAINIASAHVAAAATFPFSLMLAIMANRIHEIWIDANGLPGCCLSGKDGDGFRKLLDRPAKIIRKFAASNHIDAMTKYYKIMNWGEYKSDYPEIDSKPYQAHDG